MRSPEWTVGGGAIYQSMGWANNTNTGYVPEFWKFDAMISYKVDEKSTVQLNVYNLTDKLYYSQYFGGQRRARVRPLGIADLSGALVRPPWLSVCRSPAIGGRPSTCRADMPAMMVHIPNVLTAEQVARCRAVMEKAVWVDGRSHRRAPIGAGEAQSAASRDRTGSARARRHGGSGARPQSPVRLRRVAEAGLSAAVQPL